MKVRAPLRNANQPNVFNGLQLKFGLYLRLRTRQDSSVDVGGAIGLDPLCVVVWLALSETRHVVRKGGVRGRAAENAVHVLPEPIDAPLPCRTVVADECVVLVHLQPVHARLGHAGHAAGPCAVAQREEVERLARGNGLICLVRGKGVRRLAVHTVNNLALRRSVERRDYAIPLPGSVSNQRVLPVAEAEHGIPIGVLGDEIAPPGCAAVVDLVKGPEQVLVLILTGRLVRPHDLGLDLDAGVSEDAGVDVLRASRFAVGDVKIDASGRCGSLVCETIARHNRRAYD